MFHAFSHQSLLGWKVVVEQAVRRAGGLHDFSDAHAREPALAEQARGLTNDCLLANPRALRAVFATIRQLAWCFLIQAYL